MRNCEAWGCSQEAKHYVQNTASGRGFHLCYFHLGYHTQGIGFDLEPAKPAAALLTGSGPTAILTLPAHTIATPEEAPMAHNVLSTLNDSLNEANEKLDAVRDALSELEDAREQLEDFIGQIESAISTIEELDGFSVSASVEIDVDVSLYL